jgi:hypothetical protein
MDRRFLDKLPLPIALVWVLLFVSPRSFGQPAIGESVRPEMSNVSDVRAVVGEPFGVATFSVFLGPLEEGVLPRVLIQDDQGRVFYPAIITKPATLPVRQPSEDQPRRIGQGGLVDRLRNAVRNTQNRIEPPQILKVSFLFRGDNPIRVRLTGDVEQAITIRPEKPVIRQPERLLMAEWWDDYVVQAKRQVAASDYPPLIQTYLTLTLARRFDFPAPDLRTEAELKRESKRNGPLSTLELLAGTESMRDVFRRRALMPDRDQAASPVRLPDAPTWQQLNVPNVPEQLPLESIAKRVPPECFYMRFGSFQNYLWFKDLSDSRSGELSQMVTMRGLNFESNLRIERMLNTKTTVLAKLFGDQIIGDMAIIGNDLYAQEGATLGVIFEAKNIDVLVNSITSERQTAIREIGTSGGRLEELTIADHPATLLSTPDNATRSFMVVHDNYLLVTTSRRLAERFTEIAHGQPSLGDSADFRYARLLMPLENNYTMLGYLSPQFFQQLLAPAYQVELRRRLSAISHIEMVELAQAMARAEGKPNESVDDLIAGEFLPPDFDKRADGSRIIRDGDRWIDATRGARGSFLPIADAEIPEISPEEDAIYQLDSAFYQDNWLQTDPLVFGLRRFANPDRPGLERVTLEAYVAPFGEEKYGWLSTYLAPPIETQIQLPPDDVANVQVHLSGVGLGANRPPNHVMFLGVKDMIPPEPAENKGLIKTLRALQATPGYLGAWPLPGYLDRLPLGLGGPPPDVMGFSKLLLGLWRWQGGGFSVLSFDRSILENCALYLRPVPATDPAQVRLQVGDLSDSKLSTWVNTFWYRRGAATTQGNLLLLDALQQQLRIDPSQSRLLAERFLQCKMQCPLGGDYQLNEDGPFAGCWTSTVYDGKVASKDALPPTDYIAPWLQWFRGGQVHLAQLPGQIVLVGQFDMQPLPPNAHANGAAAALPSMNFDLFGLPFKLLNGNKDPSSEKKPKPERKKF